MKKIKKEHFQKYKGPFNEIVFTPRNYSNYIWETKEEAIKKATSKHIRYDIEQIIQQAEGNGYSSEYLIKGEGKIRPKNFSHEIYEGVFIDFAKLGKYISIEEGKDKTSTIFLTEKIMEKTLKFIKQYGFLGGSDLRYRYESAGFIMEEMINAYNLLTLYNAVLNKDLDQFKRRIRIGKAFPFPWGKEKLEETFSPVVDGKSYSLRVILKKPIDYLACAFFCLACEIQERVKDVYLGFGNIERLKKEKWPEDIEHPGMFFNSVLICPSLLSYMYLRFYLVITNMRPLLTCKECSIPFFPKRIKKDNKFCSNSCRIKYWKRNNKK